MNEEKIKIELERATIFQQLGQEGKARVLARRALGEACASLLQSHHAWQPGMNALDSITQVKRSSFLQPEWAGRLPHFLQLVNKEHQLPDEIDLVVEAKKKLIEAIIPLAHERSHDNESN
jgi:hypothetical protein